LVGFPAIKIFSYWGGQMRGFVKGCGGIGVLVLFFIVAGWELISNLINHEHPTWFNWVDIGIILLSGFGIAKMFITGDFK
jgi:hypothetical protein